MKRQWLTDAQYCRLSEVLCKFFPYRTREYRGIDNLGPTRWQWPDILRRPMR